MFKIRIRAIVGILIFLGYFIMYIVRYNISVHIVDMVQIIKRNEYTIGNKTIVAKSGYQRTGMTDLMNWDDKKIGRLFSAYHIGYCICFPIFHSVGDRLGPTWVVGIAGMLSGVLNALTPATAYYNFWALFAVRIIKGFCAGAMQPSMVQVLRYWVPPIERNYFMWAYCGITTGTFSTFLICAAVQYYSRWPVGYYVIGGSQIVWAVIWITVVTDYPRRHPFISAEELEYLLNSISNIFTIKMTNAATPWRLILRSVPFWTLCILNFGYSWMIFSLCLYGPLYYSEICKYTIYSASAITALPFFLRSVFGTILIHTYQKYKNEPRIKRIKHIRKYFIIVSHVIPGLLVCSTWLLPIIPGPILLTLAVALTAAGMDLTFDLCYELTPTFVNSINTVIKIIGNTSGIIISLCVGQVTYTYKNFPSVWKHIWCFHALILFMSGLVFLIWGETEIQPWNYTRKNITPRPKVMIKPMPSIMSNIAEVEEGSVRSSLAKIPSN